MKNAFGLVRDIEGSSVTVPQAPPSFGDTIGATLSFRYGPMTDYLQENRQFGFDEPLQAGYVPRDHIPEDLKAYSADLLRATNQDHMDFLVGSLRRNLDTRNVLARSSTLATIGAEFFDLTNYVSIPFAPAKTLAGSLYRGGMATAAAVAAQESIRAPLDPLSTKSEVAFSIGSGFLFGGILNGVVTTPSRKRIEVHERAVKEIDRLREAIEKPDIVGEDLGSLADADASIASSMFTDSWLFKAVTTPMKRTLQDPNIPNSVKVTMLDIANDSGILLAANKKGIAFKNSVFQNAKLRDGEWVQTFDDLVNTWGESTGAGTVRPMDYMYKTADFEDWLTEIDAKAMRGEKPATDFEARAMESINKFYGDWEIRLSDSGLIGSKSFYVKDIKKRQAKIDDISSTLERYRGTKQYDILQDIIDVNKKAIDSHNQTIRDIDASGPVTPANEEIFRPRYWDKDHIRKNRAGLEKILTEWFRDNPDGYGFDKNKMWTKVRYDTSDASIAKRASDAVDNILGLKDVTDFDSASFGYGKSKHMKHRGIDIPNKLVMDYIHRNPVSIMKAYTARTAARYEFAVKFGGQDIEDVLNDKMVEMLESGATIEQSRAALKDLRHMYDRVAGTVLREPDTLNQKFAEVMRTAAQLNYLGSAGLSTITEPARIIMEHGLGNTMKGLFTVLDKSQLKMGAREARIAGEALEILMGSSHMRLVEDMGNNPLRSTYMDKGKNAFFMLNGLAPATRILKDFEGMMRSHTLIDYSVRWSQGKATKMEQEYLLRYNIDLDVAGKIANSPWQKSSSGLYVANTEAWTNTIEFPSTTAEVVSGPTKSYAANGRYKPAFYREKSNKIFIDEEYIKDVMWPERGWENPRVEGVNPIEEGIINTPDDYVTFIKMHEIMHTNHRPEDLGFVKEQSEEIVVDNSPNGMSRREIINNIESGSKNPDLAFHVANDAESIIKKGFRGGGTVRGTPVVDAGYGEFVTVFDVRSIVEKLKSNQEFLDAFEITADQVDDFLESKMYGESLSVEKYGASSKEVTSFKLLEGEKPVAVIHISELPSFSSRRVEGDRMNELGDQQGMYTAETRMVEDYRSGVLNRENVDSYSIPPSYWGGTEDEFFEDLDKIIAEQERFADIGKNYRPFEEKVSRSSKVVDKANYENAINDLTVAEIKKQARVDPETVKSFRNALGSGIANTILMGTPADKPIITDGVAYIPMRVASQFGMKEDKLYKGYARIENPLLGMPFQFMSYSLAAVNKTTAALAHGQVKSQFIGTAISLGLGYMLLQAKTPDYIEMDFQDKFARSFDYSGVASLYSDLFYTAMSTSLALGGPNLTGNFLTERFPQEPDLADAATGILGAGPSITSDIARGMWELTTGNVGEGSKEIIRNLPFARLWFLKGKMNEMTRMLETELDEPSGFGRY